MHIGMLPDCYLPKYPTLTSEEFALWTVVSPNLGMPGESAVQAAMVSAAACEPQPESYRIRSVAYQQE